MRSLRRWNRLSPGYYGSLKWTYGDEPAGDIRFRVHPMCLELIYKTRQNGGEWQDVRDWVFFSNSDQHFGGTRKWLVCPKCHRRCAVLHGGTRFRCRKCCNLAYASQTEDVASRLLRKARKIRVRLGEDGGFDDPWPEKPKGMHWKTYHRLTNRCDELETQADEAFACHAAHLVGLL